MLTLPTSQENRNVGYTEVKKIL